MNITEIIDNGATLTLRQDVNTNVIILKQFCKLRLQNDIVTLYDCSTSNQANKGEAQEYNLYFAKIINPATPSAIVLENLLNAYIQTGISTGNATAGNQLIEIARLTEIVQELQSTFNSTKITDTLQQAVTGETTIDELIQIVNNQITILSNQVVQITQVDDTTPFISVFKDNTNASIFKELVVGNPSVFLDAVSGLSWLRKLKNLDPITYAQSFQITRPADVIPYTVGDAINDNVPIFFKFTDIGLDNNSIANLVAIHVFDTSNVAIKPVFNYFFFSQQPVLQVDNTPINMPDITGLASFIGCINGATITQLMTALAGNSVQQLNLQQGMPMQVDGGTSDIWVIIGLANGYVPVASEQFKFTFYFRN